MILVFLSKNVDIPFINQTGDAVEINELLPFSNHLQRWSYRQASAYYLCNYAVKKEPMLIKFGADCKKHVNPKYTQYLDSATDNKPFHCALLSFCPDFCYGRAYKENQNPLTSSYNPCQGIGSGVCELNPVENNNFDDFKKNDVNFTCECPSGTKFLSKYGLCIDIDECDENIHSCYEKHQTCLNTPTSYECLCKRGYKKIKGKNETLKCIRFTELEDLENKINQTNEKYSREKLINLFEIIHKSKIN